MHIGCILLFTVHFFCLLFIVNSLLCSVHCFLFSYLIFVFFCLLITVCCLLSTVYCLLYNVLNYCSYYLHNCNPISSKCTLKSDAPISQAFSCHSVCPISVPPLRMPGRCQPGIWPIPVGPCCC